MQPPRHTVGEKAVRFADGVGTHLAGLTGLLPRPADYQGLRRSWFRDVLAGVTVGVVALPLALGFGVASGAGAAAGLVTAIVAGTDLYTKLS